MTIEKTFQGAWRISQIQFNELFSKQYFFNKPEAIKLFREDLMHNFLKNSLGWQSIAHTEKKTAERLEAKGIIEIAKHPNTTWQIKLK